MAGSALSQQLVPNQKWQMYVLKVDTVQPGPGGKQVQEHVQLAILAAREFSQVSHAATPGSFEPPLPLHVDPLVDPPPSSSSSSSSSSSLSTTTTTFSSSSEQLNGSSSASSSSSSSSSPAGAAAGADGALVKAEPKVDAAAGVGGAAAAAAAAGTGAAQEQQPPKRVAGWLHANTVAIAELSLALAVFSSSSVGTTQRYARKCLDVYGGWELADDDLAGPGMAAGPGGFFGGAGPTAGGLMGMDGSGSVVPFGGVGGVGGLDDPFNAMSAGGDGFDGFGGGFASGLAPRGPGSRGGPGSYTKRAQKWGKFELPTGAAKGKGNAAAAAGEVLARTTPGGRGPYNKDKLKRKHPLLGLVKLGETPLRWSEPDPNNAGAGSQVQNGVVGTYDSSGNRYLVKKKVKLPPGLSSSGTPSLLSLPFEDVTVLLLPREVVERRVPVASGLDPAAFPRFASSRTAKVAVRLGSVVTRTVTEVKTQLRSK